MMPLVLVLSLDSMACVAKLAAAADSPLVVMEMTL
jgi:hypothetical protein